MTASSSTSWSRFSPTSNFVNRPVDNVVHGLSLATITGRWRGKIPFVQVSTTWALTLHTHTHTKPFNGLLSGTTQVGRYQKKHSPTHTILIIGHPLSSSSNYNDPWHPLCSVYELDSPLGQPLSRSSLAFLLALDPQLHTPCISSLSHHHHLFAAHAHTNGA